MTKRAGRPPGWATDGPKIRTLRIALGLSATQVGAMVGCDAQTVRRAERGGPITDIFVVRLAKTLDVDVREIAAPPAAKVA